MSYIRDYICTFVVPLRGSGLRRGTTCERSAVVLGRLLACRNLTLVGRSWFQTPLNFFFESLSVNVL